MNAWLERAPRFLFFTGKGGVGKTSVACASAVALADRGRRVLLVSTDPASNLDEVLETAIGSTPTAVAAVPNLSAMNIDPVAAAHAYRERVVGPYRGVLPEASVASMEEQLSGACTVEIAGFDEFSKLLADQEATAEFEHVIFDTASTGHTLRLLALPAAWTGFLDTNAGGTSCLGPLSGLKEQRDLYERSRAALVDATRTALVLVARPEAPTLTEAERTRRELVELGMRNQHLVINGVFPEREPADTFAQALIERQHQALLAMPEGLRALPRTSFSLLGFGLVGVPSLRALLTPARCDERTSPLDAPAAGALPELGQLVDELEAAGRGVVMTMGKGGVGKTTVAVAIATALARRGHAVHLTTTDPAAHVRELAERDVPNLTVSRIDPVLETRRYSEEVLKTAGSGLDASGRALLEEDLRSPCTEEIAVFRAFASTVDAAETRFVVIDTAPTGHTILLLDAAEAYHRDVQRATGEVPPAVRHLLPRLRDPGFTKVVIVTLPEATPVHEAAGLQEDLERAGIHPFAWVINQSLAPLPVSDPLLVRRRANETRFHREVRERAGRVFLLPWNVLPVQIPGAGAPVSLAT